ncbi:MAG: hypothetical protein JOS17DRAFT_737482 [Linnemannia elongata]|nr:MAG: hypothetical protein JOS17DRAFT_737482 [Linnemannia elongata]
MPAQRPLPAEVLALIFQYFDSKDLYRCLQVCRLWYDEAETRLYSNVVLSRSKFRTVKSKKHLLRRVQWLCGFDWEDQAEDVWDVFLDYRPCKEYSPSRAWPFDKSHYMRSLPPMQSVDFTLGPNHPALTHLSYHGGSRANPLFVSVLYRLTTLTTLELFFDQGGSYRDIYRLDMDRTLTALPHLKHLRTNGRMLEYATTPGRLDNRNLYLTMEDATRGPGRQQHQLKSFAFGPVLTRWVPKTVDIFMCFRRLGSLTTLSFNSWESSFDEIERNRPGALGRALQQFCPVLETVKIINASVFWLFDLAIVPSNKEHHLRSLIEDLLPNEEEVVWTTALHEQRDEHLIRPLQDQEVEELLEGRNAVPFFPHLKSLVIQGRHAFSAQDLISLGAQARLLTHLEIDYRPTDNLGISVWDIYDYDAASGDANLMPSPTPQYGLSWGDRAIQNRRLRKRRRIEGRDLMLFLRICSSLRHFALKKSFIPFELLVDDRSSRSEGSLGNDDDETQVIEPWACEGTLESLTIGFDIATDQHESHHLVWKHLGRFKKLQSLAFVRFSPSKNRSALIPSPAYGVDGLIAGGEGVNVTLTAIRALPSWWALEDGRAMVLWFARSFPKLKKLGLSHDQEYLEGKQGAAYASLLEDEDVKQCSIESVVFEPHWFE